MSRPRKSRLNVSATLVAARPLHVGGFGSDIETDLPLARDGRGRRYIPGTSFAGAIATWIAGAFGNDQLKAVFGYQKQANSGDAIADGWASWVTVNDALVIDKDSPDVEILDGVGIDRETGTAADGIKFDRAVLPKGTQLEFSMEVDVPIEPELLANDEKELSPDPAVVRGVIGYFLQHLEETGLSLGAGQTRGLGHLELLPESLSIDQEDWSTRAGILNVLKGNSTSVSTTDLIHECGIQPKPLETITWTVHWEPVGPIMSKSAVDGMAVDTLPFVSAINHNDVALMLPGASIKGTLRQRLECLLRTAMDWPAELPRHNGKRMRHLEQLDVPIARELFGYAKSAKKKKNSTEPDARRGLLSVSPCYGYRQKTGAVGKGISAKNWRDITAARKTDDQLPTEPGGDELNQGITKANLHRTNDAGTAWLTKSDHVAIDRWTNAPVDSLLFSTLEPRGFAWDPIQLTLTLPRLPEDDDEEASSLSPQPTCEISAEALVAAVLTVLKELREGNIPLGFGVNRGFGSIRVKEIECDANTASQHLQWLDDEGTHVALEKEAAPSDEVVSAWRNTIQQHQYTPKTAGGKA